jgi:hypothetical protein
VHTFVIRDVGADTWNLLAFDTGCNLSGSHARVGTCPFINFVKNQSNKSDATKLLIGWGNWGRSPNLKGSAPTPGIGLRRRAAQRFETITIPEAYTSKTCPRCQTRTLINPKVGEKYVTAKHHLLRCTDDDEYHV